MTFHPSRPGDRRAPPRETEGSRLFVRPREGYPVRDPTSRAAAAPRRAGNQTTPDLLRAPDCDRRL